MKKIMMAAMCMLVAGLVQAIEFNEIRKNTDGATTAQFEAYANPLLGSRVYWKGWVRDVETASGDQCKVEIDMDNPANGYTSYDVVIYLPAYKAMKLKPKEPISFNGKIEKISKLFGATVYLSDVQ